MFAKVRNHKVYFKIFIWPIDSDYIDANATQLKVKIIKLQIKSVLVHQSVTCMQILFL